MSVSVIVTARFRFENDFVTSSQEALPNKTLCLSGLWAIDNEEPLSDGPHLAYILFFKHIISSWPTILLLERHDKT